ncbi:hypothetical protein [Hyalangium rubrum]|uniref:Uncharacterized protein n=1 Tax=Hyalangium rubrum TaxID=3103134 RepID=A0ABU5GZK2_9BACT|nr:hypothetical protein [Hyalangium sp. s54d21]MDY7226314.1 hypothetical protein [Hyalangium sp. s54d21]
MAQAPPPRRLALPATDAQRGRAWWAALFATGLSLLGETAYIFIDWQVHPGRLLLPSLRALHVLESVVLLALLLSRRRDASEKLSPGVFTAVALPHLVIFAVAEVAMAASGRMWMPLTGHRLLMLGIGLLAPTGPALSSGLIGAFALEAVVLWYGLGLHTRLQMPWEPWITLVWAGTGWGLLAFRVRTQRIERKLLLARAEAESLERLARLLLVLRDGTNTPLQSLELGVALLQQRAPENAVLLETMERSLAKLRALTQRMAIADPLLEWDSEKESFDVEEVLRGLEESLIRELERRRQ